MLDDRLVAPPRTVFSYSNTGYAILAAVMGEEVNFTLQLFYADYATLRRYLVDEEFMTRADGVYWRSGGRFPAR